MKTQLLEDIGQNATLPLAPLKKTEHPAADKALQDPAPPAIAGPATPQPDQQPAGLDLDSVFEEIAALEAQYVPPGPHREPVLAPTEPGQPEQPVLPNDTLRKPARTASFTPDPAQTTTVPLDPVFDFTLPGPAAQAAEPFTRSPSWPTRSGRRRLLWSAGLLAAALLAAGGWWAVQAHQERNDAGSLALIANQAQETLRVDNAATQPGAAPDSDAGIAPAAPVSSPAPTPAVPPLVMLKPEPAAADRAERPAPLPAAQAAPEAASAPEPAAEPGSAFPLPKSLSRAARGQSDAAAAPAPRKREREPVRQLARASTSGAKKPPAAERAKEGAEEGAEEGPTAALLRACREHGYHAAQCIKRGCSLTQYGFACRGR